MGKRKWQFNIELHPEAVWCEDADWTELAQDRVHVLPL
jgi:hypothetical protein